MATKTYTDTAIHTCVFAAFSECPPNGFYFQMLFYPLKEQFYFP